LDDWIQCSIYAFGEWEPVITAYVRDRLKPGDVFIDIGANIGYYSILAGIKVGTSGFVHAIEASPRTFDLLNSNLSINFVTNVQTYNVAVADKSGELTLWVREKDNIGRSTVVEVQRGDSGIVESRVRSLPLPAIVPENDILRARFIKIDVEGAEWLVLQGIKHLLPRFSPNTEILFEVGAESLRFFGTTVGECLKLFHDAGFEPWVIDAELNQPFYAPQRAGVGIKPLTDEIDRYEFVDLLFRRA
jgi:FkbM family methyltransferase